MESPISEIFVEDSLINDWERERIIKRLDRLEIDYKQAQAGIKRSASGIAFFSIIWFLYNNIVQFSYILNFGQDTMELLKRLYFLAPIFISLFIITAVWSSIQSHRFKFEIGIIEKRLSKLYQTKPVFPASVGQSTVTTLTMPTSETSIYFKDLLKINLRNLGDYYDLIKIHTNKSFDIARVSGILGFILITLGLGAGYFSQDNKLAYLSAAAGLIIEFVSGIFFYLYNKTIGELKGYHDSLLDVQNVIVSYKLIDDIQDQAAKNQAIDKMINALVNKKGK